MYSGRNTEARAITDPTERSIPSVPMASATPRETSTTGETCISRLESVATEAKFGVIARLKTTSATKATYTPRPRTQEVTADLSRAPVTVDALFTHVSFVLRPFCRIPAVREHLHQPALGNILAGEHPDHGAVPQGDHAVATLGDLFQLRRDQDYGEAVQREIIHELLDLRLGAHVDAACWLVEYEHLRVHAKPARQKHLLLVTA